MMHHFLFILLFVSFGSNAQDLTRSQADSSYFKSRGIHVTLSPLVPGLSLNTDNYYQFNTLSSRLSLNWMVKNDRKFSWYGSFGFGTSDGSKSMNFYESGFLIGYLAQGKRRGFCEINAGLGFFGRKAREPWLNLGWGISPVKEPVREVHTIGIPFDISINTSRGIVGLGFGFVGNLNLNQPSGGINIRLRFGNPVKKNYAARVQ